MAVELLWRLDIWALERPLTRFADWIDWRLATITFNLDRQPGQVELYADHAFAE